MSEDEKAKQIGRLIQKLDEAIRDRAHIEVKIETISSVYSEVGKILSFLRVDASPGFTIESGRFRIPNSPVDGDIADGLLSEGQLIEVLRGYSEIKERVSQLESQLGKLRSQ